MCVSPGVCCSEENGRRLTLGVCGCAAHVQPGRGAAGRQGGECRAPRTSLPRRRGNGSQDRSGQVAQMSCPALGALGVRGAVCGCTFATTKLSGFFRVVPPTCASFLACMCGYQCARAEWCAAFPRLGATLPRSCGRSSNTVVCRVEALWVRGRPLTGVCACGFFASDFCAWCSRLSRCCSKPLHSHMPRSPCGRPPS